MSEIKMTWQDLSKLKHDAYEARRILTDACRVIAELNPKAVEQLKEIDDRIEAFIAQLDILILKL